MKRRVIIIIILIVSIPFSYFLITEAQESKSAKESKLVSQQLLDESKALDKEIMAINKKIEKVIADNQLLSPDNKIKILPYQMAFKRGKDFIEIEKHHFTRGSIDVSRVVGVKKKFMRISTNGQTISKLESRISDQNYDEESITLVTMIDPSPKTVETKDINFEYKINGSILKSTKLEKVRNTTAFPIKNELKRNFIIPHLDYFYNALLDITEAYKKGSKDVESVMTEFLKKSTVY